jgi:hypothetical protein
MPQKNIPYGPIPGMPGMPYDSEASIRDVVSVIAAVNIPFGTFCELNSSGLAIPMQDSTTGGSFSPSLIGIAMYAGLGVEETYQTFQVPASSTTGASATGWLKGQAVPFMRRGRIWALWDGAGTVTQYGAINVNHSSTGAFPQGVFTFSAVSATAGHEIDIAPKVTVWNPLKVVTTGSSVTDVFGNVFYPFPLEIDA